MCWVVWLSRVVLSLCLRCERVWLMVEVVSFICFVVVLMELLLIILMKFCSLLELVFICDFRVIIVEV